MRQARVTPLAALLLLMLPRGQYAKTMLGSYPHIVQNSAANLSSSSDVAATVAAWQATGQTLGGFYIDECYYFQLLRPFLEATRGTGIAIFGMLRSHNGPIYCSAVYGNSTVNSSAPAASGKEMNWTRVATTLAAVSVDFPHFIGYTVDDFYCMMQDPNVPANQFGSIPPLSVAKMAGAHAAMKAISPNFLFMPTVYPGYLGIIAGAQGFTLGIGPELPFDTASSASVTLALPAAASARSKSALSFMIASGFASWDRNGFANPVWRGKVYIRALLKLTNGSNALLADVDLFHLVGCGGGDEGSDSVSHCIPQEIMRISTGAVAAHTAWTAVTIELYARDEVNLNYYNDKIVTIWNVSLEVDGRTEPLSTLQQSFITHDSNASFNNKTNRGLVRAHNNANFSIRATADGHAACDGLLFPFAENGGLLYSSTNYNMLLQLAVDATQGHGQALWALHYGWMWQNSFGADVDEVDAAALARMIKADRAAKVDAVVVWGLRLEVSNLGSQRGIFTQRHASSSTVSAAKSEGFSSVAQAWFPGYTPGYGGFHQSWTSRSPINGNVSIGLNRAVGNTYADTGPESGPWFFSAILRVANGGPILFNASTGVIACSKPWLRLDKSRAPQPCPGMETQAAAAYGISCSVHCAATGTKLAAPRSSTAFNITSTLDAPPLAFPEVVTLTIPTGGHLSGNANGDLRLALEFVEHKGVGNWNSGCQFALPPSSAKNGDGDDVVPGWAYSAGLRDASIVSNYWAVVGAFAGSV